MREWLSLAGAELLKIGRRRLSWALLLVLVAASVLHGRSLQALLKDSLQEQQSGVSRFGQRITPETARTTTADLMRRMTFPESLNELWVITDYWGLYAVIILAALQAGEESDLGTARTLLLRGVRRPLWLLAKLTALVVAAGVLWTGLAIVNVPVGLWTQSQAGGGGSLAAVDARQWTNHFLLVGASWLTTIPYLAFTVWAATLARGAGPALALGLGGRLIEMGSAVAGMLLVGMESIDASATRNLYRIWAPLHTLSFHWSGQVVRTWGHPSWTRPLSPIPASPQELPPPSPFFRDPYLGIAVLLGWTTLWAAWAAWSMRRRDFTA